jgi:FAD/FMN-containing dehydrogenase
VRAARIQAGILGPALEEQLKPHGLTLRHIPQSWEFSSLGGWIATCSSGHYATHLTHIDDMVESLRVVTRRERSRTAACQARVRDPIRIGCSSGLRARWASSPMHGCVYRGV